MANGLRWVIAGSGVHPFVTHPGKGFGWGDSAPRVPMERAQPAGSQPVGRLQPPVQRVKSSVVRTARTAGLKDCGEAANLV